MSFPPAGGLELGPSSHSPCHGAVVTSWELCHISAARLRAPPPDKRPITSMPKALPEPSKHHLEHSEPCSAERWPKRFMCINRWCSEKPEKTLPKLTTFSAVDQNEVDI